MASLPSYNGLNGNYPTNNDLYQRNSNYSNMNTTSFTNVSSGFNGMPYTTQIPMQPVITMYGANYQPMTYEEMMIYRQQLIQQRQAYNQKMLEERYPVKYVLVHASILILLSIAAIVIQVFIIIKSISYYHIGSGIWAGVYFILAASLALLLSRTISYFCVIFFLNLNAILIPFYVFFSLSFKKKLLLMCLSDVYALFWLHDFTWWNSYRECIELYIIFV